MPDSESEPRALVKPLPLKKQIKGVINTKRLARGLAKGMTRTNAGRYAGSLARHDSNVCNMVANQMKTPAFKREAAVFVKQLESESVRLIEAMADKDLTHVDYDKMVKSLDVLNKNIQLLNGQSTDIITHDVAALNDFLNNS